MKKIITIEVEGEEERDLELAQEEAFRLIREGYNSGMDSNDTGDFNFTVTEEEN